jgi:hypothetical protein
MNRTEFESQYKAKYLNLLPENNANKFVNENRTDDGYIDDHLQVCWSNYVMQCAIDDFCNYIDMTQSNSKSKPVIKALFDLRGLQNDTSRKNDE